ncbi:hypothetical protein G9A89_000225, partial [Geosiphon pyriformis]
GPPILLDGYHALEYYPSTHWYDPHRLDKAPLLDCTLLWILVGGSGGWEDLVLICYTPVFGLAGILYGWLFVGIISNLLCCPLY